MVEIVSCDPVDQLGVGPLSRRALDRKFPLREPRDNISKLLMLFLQESHIIAQRVGIRRDGHLRPVAAFAGESTACFSREAPPDDVLPVRCVKHQLPHVVPAGMRTPQGLPRRHAPNGAGQGGAVPGLLVERLVEEPQE